MTQTDLDASRLVFVSVKDAKPKRKVAVPLPEGCSWEAFTSQVLAKLKLAAIDSIFLASSGERVTSLDQLQDIDELYVVEGALPSSSTQQNGFLPGQQQHAQQPGVGGMHRVGIADTEISPAMSTHLDRESDADAKYAKRQTSLRRTLQRVFPSLFQQTLPVTTKDVQQGAGSPSPASDGSRRRVRKRRRSLADPRTLLVVFSLLSCMGMMFFVYSRLSHGLP